MYTAAELRGEDGADLRAALDGLEYVDEEGNPIEVEDLPEDEDEDPDE